MIKSVTFGAILASVILILYCLLDSPSQQLKDLEFPVIVPLLASLALMLSACVIKDGHDPEDNWED